MDTMLQRYLDGLTVLSSLVAGELFVVTLPTEPDASLLIAFGFASIVYLGVVTYQRDLFDGSEPE